MKNLLHFLPLAAAAAVILALAPARAHAETILTFGQSVTGDTITATNPTSTTTALTGTNVPVTVTEFLSLPPTPFSAYFTLHASSIGAAQVVLGMIAQPFSGSFSITSGTGGSGANYLSGTFTDAVFGAGSGLTLTASSATLGDSVSFSSDVLPLVDLGDPRAIDLAFSNVTPIVRLIGGPVTLPAFTAGVRGDFSADPPPISSPEPASLALLAAGLFAAATRRLRR